MKTFITQFFLALALVLSAQAAGRGPLMIVATLADVTNKPAATGETIMVLGHTTNNAFVHPLFYTHRPDLSTALHNPPLYIKEVNNRGVWAADLTTATEIEAAIFGVIGDGVSDSTTALQAAINFCAANSTPTLILPKGTIMISSVSYTGTLLVGGLSFQSSPGFRSTIQGTAATTMMRFDAVRNVNFDNIWVTGNNVATNLLQFDNATQCNIDRCVFYDSAGVAIYYTGSQNYGHDIARNNFVNNAVGSVVFDAVSSAAISVRENVMQTSGGAYTNSTRGVWMRRGVANVTVYHNIIQRMYRGVEIDGENGGAQLANLIDNNYFEAISDTHVKLGGRLHSSLRVTRNFFNSLFTSGYAVTDTVGATLYGFTYADNTITPDAGLALSLTNSLIRGWQIRSGPTDVATDYNLPATVPMIMDTPSQRLVSQQITNFTVTAGVTNLSIAGDLLPNRIEFTANSNATLNVNGFIYNNSIITVFNAGTNTLTFVPTSQQIRPATEDTFLYRNGSWRRERLSYMSDAGGTMYGTLNITNALTVGGTATFNGNATFNGTAENPWGYMSYGSIGGTNIVVIAAKTGAVLGLMKDGNYYVFIGTNGVTRFTTPIEISTSTNNLDTFAGFVTGSGQIYSMTKANVINALGIQTIVATNGVSKSGSTIAFNGAAGAGITLSTNGSGQLVIASTGIYTEGNGISISASNVISGDYVPGAGISFSTNGAGQITISNTGTNSGAGSTNGSALYIDGAYAQTGNFINSSEIDPGISGTNVTLTIVANSIATNKIDATFRAFFLARANHTGTQLASTISDFADEAWARLTNSIVASNNITLAYDTSNKKLMISSTGSGGSATNTPTIAVDGVATTNINLADSAELLVTQSGTNVTYALATNGVAAGTYSNATVTVDSKGRVTTVATGSSGSSYTNTTDQIWRTVAGVRFMVTNNADLVTLDGTKTSYSGQGTNLAISGSNDRNNPIAFSLAFNPVRSNTNYLVFADFEVDTGSGSATVFVNESAGRRTNGVTFYIASTTGSVNFNQSGKFIRVWVVDPNTLISGDAISGLDASIITSGTFDVARMPSSVLLDSEAALIYGGLNNNNNWTGTQTFTNDVDFLADVSFNMLTVGTFQSTTWTNLGDVTVGSNLVVNGSITLGGVARTNWPVGATINSSGTLTNLADGIDITFSTSGGTTATPALTDTGVAAGTYTLGMNGNTATVDSKGRITAIEDFDDVNDFDVIEEFVGPTSFTLFQPTANGGSATAATSAVMPTNAFGALYFNTTGSNQYPQAVMTVPFINSGMNYAQVSSRFRATILSDDANTFEWQMGIWDPGTTTNRPKSGAWITVNTNLGNANVWLVNGTNSTYTYVDTGTGFSAGTMYQWAVRLTPSNSIAYYGATPVATNASGYPTSTYLSQFGIRLSRYFQTAGGHRSMIVDNVKAKFRAGPGR